MTKQGKSTEEKVVEAVEQVDDHLIRLSTGVVLRGKVAPPLALIKVMAAFPRPKVPTYFNKTIGREMENPDDPDYLERVQAQKTESASAMLNALVLLGTEIDSIPRGFPKPSDNDWLDEYREASAGLLFETCPIAWLASEAAEEAQEVEDVLMFCRHKILPVAGGLLDQPPRWVEALKIVDAVILEMGRQ